MSQVKGLTPPKPSNETKRLAALHRYHLLDTAPEKSFDDFTRLASFICEAPIALISFIDADRQWFKSRLGTEVAETSRDHSFCAHSVASGLTLVVDDMLEDTRFAQNPFVVSEPKIRFYAGAPLIDKEGYALGSLCVLDQKPRHLSEQQISALVTLASQVTTLVEYRRSSAELSAALEEVHTLQGLLPICMHCKNIRDEAGFWKSVEAYVAAHSNVSFSHCLCGSCLKLHYPEVYESMVEQGEIKPV